MLCVPVGGAVMPLAVAENRLTMGRASRSGSRHSVVMIVGLIPEFVVVSVPVFCTAVPVLVMGNIVMVAIPIVLIVAIVVIVRSRALSFTEVDVRMIAAAVTMDNHAGARHGDARQERGEGSKREP